MKTTKELADLTKNKHLISEAETDENGNLIRIVDGKKIIQKEEKTEADVRFNEACNLWRMRRVNNLNT